jgi:hypothetical protein
MPRQREEMSAAKSERVAALARIIAAEMMGLTADPLGEKLPDELTKQCEERAKAVLTILGK